MNYDGYQINLSVEEGVLIGKVVSNPPIVDAEDRCFTAIFGLRSEEFVDLLGACVEHAIGLVEEEKARLNA